MRTLKNQFLGILCGFLMLPAFLFAQDAPPEFVVITKAHFDMSNDDGSTDDWLATEKEYHEKVIMKNEHIRSAGVYMHYYTDDNTEINFVATYDTWQDIEDAQARNEELAEEAWSDEAERNAFFDRKDAYYLPEHSDEIYRTSAGTKPVMEIDTTPYVFYVMVMETDWPEDGSGEEFIKMHNEYMEATVHKNPYIKGVYNMRHGWGGNSRDFVVVRVVEKLGDIEKATDELDKLVEAHWTDEDARKAFFDRYDQYWTGVHRDYLYTSVPELFK